MASKWVRGAMVIALGAGLGAAAGTQQKAETSEAAIATRVEGDWELGPYVTDVSTTVGSAGGDVAVTSGELAGLRMEFPAGAAADGTTVTIRRDGDTATEEASTSLPALVSVTDRTPEARYPAFKAIMASKKKPIATMSLADIGVDASSVGTAGATTKVVSLAPAPAREAGTIVNDDGTMARLPDLELFAQEHGLKIGTIADLIGYRSRNETLIERIGQRPMQTPQGVFECISFRDKGGGLHLALQHGHWAPQDEVLVRVHEPFTALDLLDAGGGGHSWPLQAALGMLQQTGGVAVLLNCSHDASALLPQLAPEQAQSTAPRAQLDLRTYGVGAQILRELGVRRMRLLGSPRRMPSMAGYGLEITGFTAAPAARA